jgi:3-deoxy-manno-octulosonate cytidylyltransferase (CMP-KDO synthetase)
MKFTAIVPARYASTRFPGKPLIDLGGLPMVVRVAQRALQSGASSVVVATDDERIAAACRSHSVAVVMTRSDHATGTDRLSEVATRLALADHEIVVNVQGDEPLIPPTMISRTAEWLASHPAATMATLCHPIDQIEELISAHVVKCVLDEQGDALYFSRAPIPYARDAFATEIASHGKPTRVPQGLPVFRHIGLYAYRASFLRTFPSLSVPAIERFESLEQLRAMAHGYKISVMQVSEPLPPGIDTPADYEALKARF